MPRPSGFGCTVPFFTTVELGSRSDAVGLAEVDEDAVLAALDEGAEGRKGGDEEVGRARDAVLHAVVARPVGLEGGGRAARSRDAQVDVHLDVALGLLERHDREVVGLSLARGLEGIGEGRGLGRRREDRGARRGGEDVLEVAQRELLAGGVDGASPGLSMYISAIL